MSWRYRGLMLLAAVVLSQLLLLAYQVRRKRDIPIVRNGTVLAVTPIQKGMNAITSAIGGVWSGYVGLHGARRENESLHRELSELKLENQRLREQADEARRLQVLFDLKQRTPAPTLAATVISTSASDNTRLLTIDKGAQQGLVPDLPVMVPDGIIGKVLHVFPGSAQVQLITDPYSGVACLIENTRVHGILKGQGGPEPLLNYVPNGDEVKPGQRLITSGEDQIYPKGLPVGEVIEATRGPEFQHIVVRPYASLNRIEEVLVLLNNALKQPEIAIAPRPQPPKAQAESQLAGESAAAGTAAAKLQQSAPAAVSTTPLAQTKPASTPQAAAAGETPPQPTPASAPSPAIQGDNSVRRIPAQHPTDRLNAAQPGQTAPPASPIPSVERNASPKRAPAPQQSPVSEPQSMPPAEEPPIVPEPTPVPATP